MIAINRSPIIVHFITIFYFVFASISFASQLKWTRVTDGDTIKVTNNGTVTTIRLVGIDAPELSKKSTNQDNHTARNPQNTLPAWS